MRVKAFQIPDTSPQFLATAIESWFRSEGFESQSFAGPSGTYIIQGRKDNLLRFVVGLSASLVVTVGTQPDGALTVAIGAGSWLDKYLAGISGIFLFAPLAFSAAYGVWRQDNLENKLWEHIQSRLAGAKEVPITIPAPPFQPVTLTTQE
jgi:hypothetical protein